jgi:hypothetical protein
MSYYIEWNRQENGAINATSLSLYYYTGYLTSSYSSNQYGFVQEQRYNLNTPCEEPITSTFPPTVYSNTLAYSPQYISNFEQGIFYYPIIENNYKFGSQYYNYPLELYFYYLSVSVCQKMYYYITKPYIVVDDSGNSYNVILFYRHLVIPCTVPIHYTWTLHKILYPVSSNSYTTVEPMYCMVNSIISELFTSQDNKKTCELVPEPLLFHFSTHYTYRFGFNYGLNASIPSNNGPSEILKN